MVDQDRIWYLRRGDDAGSVGPFSTEQLMDMWQKGDLEDTAAAWKENMLDWQSLTTLQPFASAERVPKDAQGMIRFHCPCGNEVVMSQKFAGRLAKCKTCGRTLRVPDPYATASATHHHRHLPSKPMLATILPLLFVLLVLGVAGWFAFYRPYAKKAAERFAAAPPIKSPSPQAASDSSTPPVEGKISEVPDTKEVPAETTPSAEAGESQDTEETAPADGESPASDEAKDDEQGENRFAGRQNLKADQKSINDLGVRFAALFRTENPTPAEKLDDFFADDCLAVFPSGTIAKGKQNVIRAYKDLLDEAKQVQRINIRYAMRSIQIFADIAILVAELNEDRQTAGTDVPRRTRFVQTFTLKRHGESWSIIHAHTSAEPGDDKNPADEPLPRPPAG